MDSGAWLANPDLDTPRIKGNHVQGIYGSTGNRYPQSIYATIRKGQTPSPAAGQPFEQGEEFDVTGDFMQGVNDAHGTQVTGVIGAERNGVNGQGVAFKADVIVGNTGANDNNNYGPFQDYNYYYLGYKNLTDTIVNANGAYRGGMINNSYGTNTKIYSSGGHILTPDEMTQLLAGEGTYSNAAAAYSVTFSGDYTFLGLDDVPGGNQYATNPSAFEWEYFYFKLKYGDNPSFLDGAYNAVKGTNVIQSWAAGNQNRGTPYLKGLYPYFYPEAEKNWLVAVGVQQNSRSDASTYKAATYCKAGLAKWWAMSGPTATPGVGTTYVNASNPGSGSVTTTGFNGTSASDPQITGAFTVLQSRYPSMTAIQVKDVMFTTASHVSPEGNTFTGWTADEGTPDVLFGWGMPDLERGMYGPGQFLDHFEYVLTEPLDVWTNNIIEAGLKQREKEDKAWMAATKNGTDTTAGGDYVLGDEFVVLDDNLDFYDNAATPEQAQAWRAEYYARRAAYIQNKIDNDLYKGALIKAGSGTLIMTGNNSYSGGTTVNAGSLFGFGESFGTAPVIVNDGGRFGLLSSYNDTFTQKGQLTSQATAARAAVNLANVVVNEGGTFVVVPDQQAQAGSIEFKSGSYIGVDSIEGDGSAFELAYNGQDQTGSVTASEVIGFNNATVVPDYAFVDHLVTLDNSTITGVLTANGKTPLSYASGPNQQRVASFIVDDPAIWSQVVSATKSQVRDTLATMGSELEVTANSLTLLNGYSMQKAIRDQGAGYGNGNVAEVDGGKARFWASFIGNWSEMNTYGSGDVRSDYTAYLLGFETEVVADNTIGFFAGGGNARFKGYGKVKTNDFNAGLYGVSKIEPVKLSYGVIYTYQHRDVSRPYVIGANQYGLSKKINGQLWQVYGEVAFTGLSKMLDLQSVEIEPYAAVSWLHLKVDGYNSQVAGNVVSMKFDNKDMAVSSLGVRGKVKLPMDRADIKLVADANWTHFYGNTKNTAQAALGTHSYKLESEKLKDVAQVSAGFEADVTKSLKVGASYYGAFGSKVKSNGFGITAKYTF